MHEPNGLTPSPTNASQSIDWYAEGEARLVQCGGMTVMVRYVGRKGRRARIAITGPAGTSFHEVDATENILSNPDNTHDLLLPAANQKSRT